MSVPTASVRGAGREHLPILGLVLKVREGSNGATSSRSLAERVFVDWVCFGIHRPHPGLGAAH